MAIWSNVCPPAAAPPVSWDGYAFGAPTITGGVNVDFNTAHAQHEVLFACAYTTATDTLVGWVFNVYEDTLGENDPGAVVGRQLGFRALDGTFTANWAIPAGVDLRNCGGENPATTAVVAPTRTAQAVQLAAAGVWDPNAQAASSWFFQVITGTATYDGVTFNAGEGAAYGDDDLAVAVGGATTVVAGPASTVRVGWTELT